MSIVKEETNILFQSIEMNRELYIQTSQEIHANPEIGNEEVFASAKHVAFLEVAGFEVTKAVAGHETSFYAVKDSGKEGPTVAFLAEYDALPGLGHACGHNIIGTTSVAAGIALAEALPETGGHVVVLGTPAEEGGPNGSAKGSFVKTWLLKRCGCCAYDSSFWQNCNDRGFARCRSTRLSLFSENLPMHPVHRIMALTH